MQVDTDVFEALTERAEAMDALGRKVSALTGKVTVMNSHLHRLDDTLEGRLPAIVRLFAIIAGVEDAHEPKHAAKRRNRHGLRAVEGGKP